MDENKLTDISKADSLEKIGEFWDNHDFTEFDTHLPDIEYKVSCMIKIETDLLSSVEKQARIRGVNVETLINLWLYEKLGDRTV